MPMLRLGYLIPEFPGQTHNFFWRERSALLGLGIQPVLLSTRYPAAKIVSHTWANEASAETTYLRPPGGVRPLLAGLAAACLRHPLGLVRCGSSILRAEGVSAAGRLRLVALAVVGCYLVRLAKLQKFNHVHVHSCADAAHVALFAHLCSGLGYSMTLHGPLKDYGPNQREKWRHARLCIIITKRILGEVQAELAGFLPPRLEVAPMGVDTQRLSRQAAYAPYRGQATLRLVSCGRLNPCKGYLDLFDAMVHLRDNGLTAHLTVAGEDETGGQGYRLVLEAALRERRLESQVTLLGAVSEAVLIEHLEQAHIFALASLAEPLGVAIMEAMALSVPVVVTGAGGVPELIEDEVDGLLVPPEDGRSLAAAISRVAADPALAARLAAAGRLRVEREFSSRRSAEVIADFLKRQAATVSAAFSHVI